MIKYVKDLIMNSDIYNFYDNTYFDKNEYYPYKSIIKDIMDCDINNDNNEYIYVLLSLQSENNIINCKDTQSLKNSCEYISHLYKHYVNENAKKFYDTRCLDFHKNKLFVFQIDHLVLEDYDENKLREFVINCIDNEKFIIIISSH